MSNTGIRVIMVVDVRLTCPGRISWTAEFYYQLNLLLTVWIPRVSISTTRC